MRRVVAAVLALLAALPAAVAQGEKVDAAVVFLVDASGSMSAVELAMARASHVSALTSDEVLSAIATGEHGRIAIAYVEFADRPQARIGWTLINGAASASAFAEVVATGDAPIPGSMTGLGAALAAADALFDTLPYKSTRLVVDIVGDGRNNLAPHTIVGRRSLLARGAVINALPLMLSPDDDFIDAYFAHEVAGGPGHFIVPITAIDAMPTALRSKIVLELY